MKLLRYRDNNLIKPAILDNEGKIRDLSLFVEDWTGETISYKNINKLIEQDFSKFPTVKKQIRLAPCIDKVGKLICVGLNYYDHAIETGLQVPNEPILFMKATSSICGANDDIIIPKNSRKTDLEVELGIIIGKKGKYIKKNNALDYIAGYCIMNDVSEREFQIERMGQWFKGKSSDTFGPIGPYLVTTDEIKDPHNLNIWSEVNGKVMQNGSTSNMIYKIDYLVSYISQFMSLHPGDIISTGTPDGC